MNIAVVGTGYVGLVTGTCFAETGNTVTCIDIDSKKVSKMRAGQVPIYEPDLEILFKRNITEKRLQFTTDLSEGIKDADVIFLALPTPQTRDGSADLTYIFEVADKLGKLLKSYAVIIDKSTVPVGTAEKVASRIAKHAKVAFDVASNPEFLREGFAVSDFMKPDRVVIGTSSKKAQTLLKELYDPFVRQGNPIYFMNARSAELTKYAANSFLATKISFMNEIANLCELVGADVDAVRLGMGADERIGKRFLFPGIGYGGSCFPKDVVALSHTSDEHGYDFKILRAVSEVNTKQRQRLFEKVLSYYKNDIKGKKFALWGLAFKPDTDDIREAPAVDIIKSIVAAGATIKAYDPAAIENVKAMFKGDTNITFANDEYEVLDSADALLIATEWPVFRTPDYKKIQKLLKEPVIFDGRNLYEIETMRAAGFHYDSIGREIA